LPPTGTGLPEVNCKRITAESTLSGKKASLTAGCSKASRTRPIRLFSAIEEEPSITKT